ncbi:hypothetical protein BK663_14050 [Pseudomonas lini]|uniref:Uncharacterized protein n=1 Tax=Pseudomonas lini TaxID=163011 RepID=A0A423IM26_9PSED|nr:hypothetical protein BK663_14050 [Pseudomonas lini]
MSVSLIDEFQRYREQTFVAVSGSKFRQLYRGDFIAGKPRSHRIQVITVGAGLPAKAASPAPYFQQTETKMPGAMPGIFL